MVMWDGGGVSKDVSESKSSSSGFDTIFNGAGDESGRPGAAVGIGEVGGVG